jgi:hypothetical protein
MQNIIAQDIIEDIWQKNYKTKNFLFQYAFLPLTKYSLKVFTSVSKIALKLAISIIQVRTFSKVIELFTKQRDHFLILIETAN